jgi:hypothetical protein
MRTPSKGCCLSADRRIYPDSSKTNTSIVHHLVIWKAAHFIVELCKQVLISMNTVRNIPSDREDCQAQNEVKAANRIVGIAILL